MLAPSLFVLAVMACDHEWETGPFPPERAIVIAHRGASAVTPEHTFAAYDLALEQGADYIELDVQRSRDGALVVIHDAILDRTARGSPTDCTGRVVDKTLAQLESCDAGSWFNVANPAVAQADFVGLRIPTLANVIARYGSTARLYIETKDPESYPGIEGDIVSLLRSNGLAAGSTDLPRVFIQSFSKASLQRLHALDPALRLVQLFGAIPPAQIIVQIGDARSYGAGIGLVSGAVTAALVDAVHASCLFVHAYTVDDSAEMQSLLAMGVDGIFTDRPGLLRGIVDRAPPRVSGESRCAAVAR